MPNLGVPELLIIAVLLVVLFGARRLPDAARSLGRSMRIFKSEVKEMHKDDEDPKPLTQNQPQAAPTQTTADYRDTL
ncbi:Sec-independent protein translocase subunit TatA [Corynebacterium sp. zg-331]|uniref:Sec-independent protein translocase subunit TatA n=1 Tax=unclassified Corynebacterium TaxID=2624378 RepID=UPI00128D8E46|nr:MULTISPECIES: Sec-independent protein translocase subunit TatA [unclassified Corynebacterium]MBC3185570.1 Sec-independent protein translocase subunit TatA [Corynebacterium sp. zg-331]MPV52064.1 twin-arginine translocase TatA/TatE family subunit [Corynebacterium sp. zg331]